MNNSPNEGRNRIIVKLRNNGVTYTRIGEIFNLSPQRIRQICIHHQRREKGMRADIKYFTALERHIEEMPTTDTGMWEFIFWKKPNISGRVEGAIRRNMYRITIGEFIEMTDEEILRIQQVGEKTAKGIMDFRDFLKEKINEKQKN